MTSPSDKYLEKATKLVETYGFDQALLIGAVHGALASAHREGMETAAKVAEVVFPDDGRTRLQNCFHLAGNFIAVSIREQADTTRPASHLSQAGEEA